MDDAELLHLYEHGYVIFRQIVPLEMCAEALRVIDAEATPGGLGGEDPALLDLFRKTPLMQKALHALGPNVTGWAQPKNPKGRGDGGSNGEEVPNDQAPRSCQIAKVGASSGAPSDRIGGHGFKLSDMPIYEPSGGPWHGHMDGVWSGGSAPLQSRDEDPTEWYTGPPGNGCPGPNDPHPAGADVMRHINWTSLVGVALTDQSQPGSGNLGVLDVSAFCCTTAVVPSAREIIRWPRSLLPFQFQCLHVVTVEFKLKARLGCMLWLRSQGMHHEMERFYREQHAAGGPIGPDGPGWPRENLEAENGHGLNMVPPFLNGVTRNGALEGPGGLLFPKPTLVLLDIGDAVICHHGVPHVSPALALPALGHELGEIRTGFF